jgi:hypothetical protein
MAQLVSQSAINFYGKDISIKMISRSSIQEHGIITNRAGHWWAAV